MLAHEVTVETFAEDLRAHRTRVLFVGDDAEREKQLYREWRMSEAAKAAREALPPPRPRFEERSIDRLELEPPLPGWSPDGTNHYGGPRAMERFLGIAEGWIYSVEQIDDATRSLVKLVVVFAHPITEAERETIERALRGEVLE